MTPMIDMVFLLLVFFMTVSTLAQAGRRVEVALPESWESEVPKDLSNRGTVSIDEAGHIYVGSVRGDLAAMKSVIRQCLEEKPDLRIHVRASQETPFSLVRKVLKGCAEAGAYEVIYATYQAR